MKIKTLGIIIGSLLIVGCGAYFLLKDYSATFTPEEKITSAPQEKEGVSLPPRKLLQTDYHIFQTFNNCAPAALSMALSYYGVNVSQEALAADLRPYHNLTGKDDDKSTPPEELGEKATEYGLIPYFRADGDIELLRKILSIDLPIVIRTLLEPGKDYAHYRVIKGYDDATGELIQDDSLQGKNLLYTYEAFLTLWKPFNYEYLVLVPKEKQKAFEAILGTEADSKTSWEHAVKTADASFEKDSNDINAGFNRAVANYYLGDYAAAVRAFEQVEARLLMRTLWYQIEPIQAYFEQENYERVFALAESILLDNKAFTELYLLKGKSYLAEGEEGLARSEFEKAVLYNKNSKSAEEALASVH